MLHLFAGHVREAAGAFRWPIVMLLPAKEAGEGGITDGDAVFFCQQLMHALNVAAAIGVQFFEEGVLNGLAVVASPVFA